MCGTLSCWIPRLAFEFGTFHSRTLCSDLYLMRYWPFLAPVTPYQSFCLGSKRVRTKTILQGFVWSSLAQGRTNFSAPNCNKILVFWQVGILHHVLLGRVRLGYSGIRIYSGIYSSYATPGSRIGGIRIQVFRNENSSQTNAYSHYSNYCYSGLIPNERALRISP